MAGKGGDFLAGAPGCPGWPGTLTAASLQPFGQSPIVCWAVPSSGCRPGATAGGLLPPFLKLWVNFLYIFLKLSGGCCFLLPKIS